MKHRSTTSIISSIMLASFTVQPSANQTDCSGPSLDTIRSLQLFARTFHAEEIALQA